MKYRIVFKGNNKRDSYVSYAKDMNTAILVLCRRSSKGYKGKIERV